MIARFFPPLSQYAFVGITMKQVHIFNFVNKCLIVHLSTILVGEIDIEHKSFKSEIGADQSFQFAGSITNRNLVVWIPCERLAAIKFYKYFLASCRINAYR